MEMMHTAMDNGRFIPAKIAAPARLFCRHEPRRIGALKGTSLNVKSGGTGERSESDGANCEPEDGLVLLALPESGGNQSKPNQNEQTARDQREAAKLLAHQNTFLQKREFFMIPRRKKVHREHIGFWS
jgi:hypothetical protein